jgi:hypothetical protein
MEPLFEGFLTKSPPTKRIWRAVSIDLCCAIFNCAVYSSYFGKTRISEEFLDSLFSGCFTWFLVPGSVDCDWECWAGNYGDCGKC